MHAPVMKGIQELMDKHVPKGTGKDSDIAIDVGSYNVNGSLEPMVRSHWHKYIGIDIRKGPGVDLVMNDPYTLPIDYQVPLVVSCSCLEHCINPWRLMQDVYRIMAPGALVILCAPFNWQFHPHPNDYYRYTYEGLAALCTEVGLEVIEAYMNEKKSNGKQDSFCVARKA